MAKITITIEDAVEGVLIVSDPSMHSLMDKSKVPHKHMTLGESIALSAWAAIASHCAAIGNLQAGELH